MIVGAVFLSIVLLALAVIVGAVIFAIVAPVVHGLASLMRRAHDTSSSDTPSPQQLGMSKPPAGGPIGSGVPPTEVPACSAETMWESVQGTRRSATASRKSRRRAYSS